MPMITAAYTRPANTTAYTANDAMSDSASSPTVLTFAGCAASGGGSGWILGVTAICSANQTTLPQLRLYLFDTTATATNDNAEFNITDAQALTCIGSFLLDNYAAFDETAAAAGSALDETDPTENRPLAFTCASGSTDLYGLVKVENGYTPVSAEVNTFRLHITRE